MAATPDGILIYLFFLERSERETETESENRPEEICDLSVDIKWGSMVVSSKTNISGCIVLCRRQQFENHYTNCK